MRYHSDMKNMQPDISFTGSLFLGLREGDCIYIWRRGEVYLYIGASGKLLHRLCYHDKINKCEALLPNDTIEIHLCPKDKNLYILEAELHELYKPKYSKPNRGYFEPESKECKDIECILCKKTFRQIRYWQKVCSKSCRKKTYISVYTKP